MNSDVTVQIWARHSLNIAIVTTHVYTYDLKSV